MFTLAWPLLKAFILRNLGSVLLVAAVGAAALTVYGWHRAQLHAAYDRGVMAERLEWAKESTRQARQRDSERREAQLAVDEKAEALQKAEFERNALRTALAEELEAAISAEATAALVVPKTLVTPIARIR